MINAQMEENGPRALRMVFYPSSIFAFITLVSYIQPPRLHSVYADTPNELRLLPAPVVWLEQWYSCRLHLYVCINVLCCITSSVESTFCVTTSALCQWLFHFPPSSEIVQSSTDEGFCTLSALDRSG